MRLLGNSCGNEPSTPRRSKHSWRNAGGKRSSLSPGHCAHAPSRASRNTWPLSRRSDVPASGCLLNEAAVTVRERSVTQR